MQSTQRSCCIVIVVGKATVTPLRAKQKPTREFLLNAEQKQMAFAMETPKKGYLCNAEPSDRASAHCWLY